MAETKTATEAVYCNNCGTANPRNSVVCCSCGHVHAITLQVPEQPEPAIVVEQRFWVALRFACGAYLCIVDVIPSSGTVFSAALAGQIMGALALPVLIAVLLGDGKWGRSSRWFLGAALAISLMHYFRGVFGSIHLR